MLNSTPKLLGGAVAVGALATAFTTFDARAQTIQPIYSGGGTLAANVYRDLFNCWGSTRAGRSARRPGPAAPASPTPTPKCFTLRSAAAPARTPMTPTPRLLSAPRAAPARLTSRAISPVIPIPVSLSAQAMRR